MAWVEFNSMEDFYRHFFQRFPPPEWVPTAKASGTTNERENKDMAVQLVHEGKAGVERRIAELEAQLRAEESKLLDFVPAEPTAPFSVVRFQKWSAAYTYAALKIKDRWYLTQDGSRSARQGVPPKTWAELVEFIGERNWRSIEVLS